jgi:hypothetical protein
MILTAAEALQQIENRGRHCAPTAAFPPTQSPAAP